MKRRIIPLIFLLICLTAVSVSAGDMAYTVSVDWQMSIQGGIEYRFSDYFGIKADLGFSIVGLITADVFAAVYATAPESPWQVKFLAGIPNAGAPLTFDGAMVSFGGAVEVGRSITDRMALDLRLGAGFPLFFEEDTDMIRDIEFPFDLWPEAALSLRF